MTLAPLLDTHAWMWWVDGDRRLGRRVRDALDHLSPDDRPVLCDISLWEAATLASLRRVSLRPSTRAWLRAAADSNIVHLTRLTPEVAAEVADLPASFHRDPADRIIVATSRVMGRPLLTRDRRILQSRLVARWRPAGRT